VRSTVKIEHIARVEGHGGITVEIDDDRVSEVRFDIFEGARLLEGLLQGRSFEDVSQVASRICAICSVAHTLTSVKATEKAFGMEPSAQTQALRDLLYRGESIESHALHLFLLALPDYLNYPSVTALATDHPESVKLGLRMKKLGNLIQNTIGGREIHPVNAVVGGFARLPDSDGLVVLRNALLQGLADCETTVSVFASLPPVDFCRSSTAFAALRSAGNYGYHEGEEILVLENGAAQTVSANDYRSLSNEKVVAHSHAKHSFYRGRPFMVGALARIAANSRQLSSKALDAMARLGMEAPSDNPMDNNKAQLVELVCDVEGALETVERLLRDGVRAERPLRAVPRAGRGTAATEAPRGLLFHSYEYNDEGGIVRADVITPTALNAASIEARLRHAVEQSCDKESPALARRLEMIVRAYDPCISCAVHVLRKS